MSAPTRPPGDRHQGCSKTRHAGTNVLVQSSPPERAFRPRSGANNKTSNGITWQPSTAKEACIGCRRAYAACGQGWRLPMRTLQLLFSMHPTQVLQRAGPMTEHGRDAATMPAIKGWKPRCCRTNTARTAYLAGRAVSAAARAATVESPGTATRQLASRLPLQGQHWRQPAEAVACPAGTPHSATRPVPDAPSTVRTMTSSCQKRPVNGEQVLVKLVAGK